MDIVVDAGSTQPSGDGVLAAHVFDAHSGEKAFLLLQTSGGSSGETLEEECMAIIRHSLLATEGEPWNRLDGTLKELNGLFKGILLGQVTEEMHAVVGLYDATHTLHVSHAGRGEAYLARGGSTSQITEFNRGKPVSAFVHIASGMLEPGDRVILSTQRLLRTFTPAQLATIAEGEDAIEEIVEGLEAERETAAVMCMSASGRMKGRAMEEEAPVSRSRIPPSRRGAERRRERAGGGMLSRLPSMDRVKELLAAAIPFVSSAARQGATIGKKSAQLGRKAVPKIASASGSFSHSAASFFKDVSERTETFLADLRHPERKRRAHLLLLSAAVAAFLVILLLVNIVTGSQRSKTRTELADLMQQIESEIRTADNRKLAGDTESADTILTRAEEQAKQILANGSGLFQTEASDLLDTIRQKREELNNILRLSPRVVVNVSSKNASVTAQGLIGLGDGEMVIYDRQNAYRVLLNKIDEPRRVSDDELVLAGTSFPRFKSQVFLTTGNSLIEMSSSQLTPMKTDDPEGWMSGKDVESYLRYLYLLSPEKKQIYKYERLPNRYGAPSQYNVNGDLTGALDMAIDGSVYVLKEGGTILKLLRGEVQPFSIRNAPKDVLKSATKMFKVTEGNFYFLDPVNKRVSVIADGGVTGEASYTRQYVLEGDQVGTLQDLYVDPEETHLYVLDEKRVYVVDLTTR